MRFQSFKAFYPYYLSEHSNSFNRFLHFIGTLTSIGFLVFAVLNANPVFILYALLSGYSFAWIGHLVIEKNRPATFQYPLYSLMGDFKMFWDLLTLRQSF